MGIAGTIREISPLGLVQISPGPPSARDALILMDTLYFVESIDATIRKRGAYACVRKERSALFE
jgi:hypothetical protein